MRELFGPVSTNVNWYNDGARRYNKKKKRKERGREGGRGKREKDRNGRGS